MALGGWVDGLIEQPCFGESVALPLMVFVVLAAAGLRNAMTQELADETSGINGMPLIEGRNVGRPM